jgi:hypothetical protein
MPWAFSPKHYLPGKNQNVANLWKTTGANSSIPVWFLINDRSPMPDESLPAILRHAQHSASPLTVTLQGGLVRELLVRSVGDSWFSGHETGALGGEFVISLRAVHMIAGHRVEHAPESSGLSAVPLHAMLLQLERQRTLVIIHLPELSVAGRIGDVGVDFLRLSKTDATQVLIPLAHFLWLEACG